MLSIINFKFDMKFVKGLVQLLTFQVRQKIQVDSFVVELLRNSGRKHSQQFYSRTNEAQGHFDVDVMSFSVVQPDSQESEL